MARGPRRLFLHKAACLLTATSLIPILVLAPLGPGAIIIHEHHEEHLHAHKVQVASGRTSSIPGCERQGGATAGHDHPAGTTVDLDGTQLVLMLSDLPRLSPSAQGSAVQVNLTPPADISTCIPAPAPPLGTCNLTTESPSPGTLRADRRIATLLLHGHTLLI